MDDIKPEKPYVLNVRIPRDVLADLDRYREAQDWKPSRNRVVLAAIRHYLKKSPLLPEGGK